LNWWRETCWDWGNCRKRQQSNSSGWILVLWKFYAKGTKFSGTWCPETMGLKEQW